MEELGNILYYKFKHYALSLRPILLSHVKSQDCFSLNTYYHDILLIQAQILHYVSMHKVWPYIL